MNTVIGEHDLYVFDLDGTLYDQPKLRVTMALRLLKYYVCHPFKIKELFIIYKFRKVKDKWVDGRISEVDEVGVTTSIDVLDIEICKKVATDNKISHQEVCDIVEKWIYENPLSALTSARDAKLIEGIESLKSRGKKVVIWSDYPVDTKLKALRVEADGAYSATDDKIGELKPSPKGMELIISDFGFDKSRVIMIGDRLEKDGEAAKNAGVDYVILPRKVRDRNIVFE